MFKNYNNGYGAGGNFAVGRKSISETEVRVHGEYANYTVSVTFLADYDMLRLSTRIYIRFPKKSYPMLKELILLLNSRILVGQFILTYEPNTHAAELSFALSQPFFKEHGADVNAVSRYIEILVTTLNQCHPCFEAVKDGELTDLSVVDLFMCENVFKG